MHVKSEINQHWSNQAQKNRMDRRNCRLGISTATRRAQLLPCCLLLLQVSHSTPYDSFVHLHAVINLPPEVDPQQLPVHTYYLAPQLVGDTGWPTLTISTAVDGSLAPPGKQVRAPRFWPLGLVT